MLLDVSSNPPSMNQKSVKQFVDFANFVTFNNLFKILKSSYNGIYY